MSSSQRAPPIRSRRAAGRASVPMVAIYELGPFWPKMELGIANPRVDPRVQQIQKKIDADDHAASHDHQSLHDREVAKADALVQEPANPRPGKDRFDDDRNVDHDDQVDPG